MKRILTFLFAAQALVLGANIEITSDIAESTAPTNGWYILMWDGASNLKLVRPEVLQRYALTNVDAALFSITNIYNVGFSNAEAALARVGSMVLTNPVSGTKVEFADPDSNFTATDIQSAVAELDNSNGSGPNASDGKVEWSQLVGVPAGFADGTDDGGVGDGYATIQEESSDLTARSKLAFTGDGLTAADDAGNSRTVVSLASPLNELAGGSLSGSYIGSGIDAANVDTGELPDEVIPDGITRDSEIGLTPYSVTTTDASVQPIYTNTPPDDSTTALRLEIVGRGPTDSAFYALDSLWLNSGGTVSLVGSNEVTAIESDAGLNAYCTLTSPNIVLNVVGLASQNIVWTVRPTVLNSPNGAASGGGVTYLFNEGFEGSGVTETWTSSGTADWDEATIYKVGSQSLELGAGTATGYVITPPFAATSDMRVRLAFRCAALPTVGSKVICQFRNSTTATAYLYLTTAGLLQFKQQGGSSAQPVTAVSTDTWYFIWLRSTISSGAGDGFASVGIATTLSEPTSGNGYAEISNGTTEVPTDNVRLWKYESGASGSYYFDDYRGAAEDIANDP